jgi:hypothetical protein
MNRYHRLLAFSLISISAFITGQCLAQEPTDTASTADLRRELAELRATVAELTQRLDAMEYQHIPRADFVAPEFAEPRQIEPSFTAPPLQPVRFPVEVHQLPRTISAAKRGLPSYLLFPGAIERAMMNSSKQPR